MLRRTLVVTALIGAGLIGYQLRRKSNAGPVKIAA